MLEILGVTFLLLLTCAGAAFAGGILWLRLKVQEASVVVALEESLAEVPIPALTPAPAMLWHHDKEAVSLCKEFQGNGAIAFADYHIKEIDDTCVRALTIDSPPAYVTINDHKELGVWADVILLPVEGGTITFSNVTESRENAPMPTGHELVQVPANAHPDSMIGYARSRLLNAEFKTPVTTEFENIFDQIMRAYHECIGSQDIDQAWLESIARESGVVLKGDEAESINAERQLVRNANIQESCLQAFAENSELSASQWEKMRGELLVIHDQISTTALVELLWENLEIPEALERDLIELEFVEATPRILASTFNSNLPEHYRMVRVATLSNPFVADIYRITEQSQQLKAA